MNRATLAAAVLVGLVASVVLQRCFAPDPEVRYRDVQVPVEVLVAQEPDTVVQFRERIVFRRVEAEQVATAPAAAIPDVFAFCSSAGWHQAQRELALQPGADTLIVQPAPPTQLLLRSFVYDRGALTLIGPRSNGDLWRGDYQVGSRFQGRVMGDSVLVQSHRFGWVRTWGERALWAGAGAALGYAVTR